MSITAIGKERKIMGFPATFIQIHYHDRPGGVTTVMRQYAQAFARISGAGAARNIVVCKNIGGLRCSNATLISVPACDYHGFRSKKSFMAVRARLINQIYRIVSDPGLPRPICVAGHNLSLGKNLALTSAFAFLAQRFKASGDKVSFFSVIHDFAEEGRGDMMRQIERVASWGWPIRADMYPSAQAANFVVVSRRNERILKAAHARVSLLLNPVIANSGAIPKGMRTRIASGLAELSRRDKTFFDPNKKTYLYPVRIISRKNIIEAFIVCCLAGKANLVLGDTGESRSDTIFYQRLLALARSYRLGVVFNISRLQRILPPSVLEKTPLLRLLYDYCDCAISTSIAEGFGYTLFETWLYSKPVLGRLPEGMAAPAEMKMDHLYKHFDVPAGWVSFDRLARAYGAQVRGTGIHSAHTDMRVEKIRAILEKEFVRRGSIDFGVLDIRTQEDIMRRCAQAKTADMDMLINIKDRMREQESVFDSGKVNGRKNIRKNRIAVQTNLGPAGFDEKFMSSFSRPVSNRHKPLDYNEIARFFAFPHAFKPLMSAQFRF